MDLKAFKGLPHEFGGIDYTEGSEVEGGEFAVNIGKNGNEYIFDKNSSEGEKLSKEFKRLDANGRLSEDDPLALEAFDQIAREEALKHAQRSVNEKGVDPFRNMYDQAGQAANGGVKYATGGPMMNPAEVPNVNPGAQYNTSMSYAPKTAEEYYRQTQGESRMRDSFGTQAMREAPTSFGIKEATPAVEMAAQALDVMFGQVVTSFGGESPGAMLMADMGYSSTDATKRAVGDDTMTGTAYGYGQAQSKDVITGMGDSFFGKEGGAMPKDKYSGGGAFEMSGGMGGISASNAASSFSGASAGATGADAASGAAAGGGGGVPWMQIVKAIKAVKGQTRGLGKTAFDESVSSRFGEEYVRQPLSMPKGGNAGGFAIPQKKKEQVEQVEQEEVAFTGSGLDQQWMMDPNQTYAMPPASDTTSMVGTAVPVDLGVGTTGFGSFGGFKSGGAKPIYGYYANGGGKKKEGTVLTGPTGSQGVIGAEGVVGPSTGYSTSNQVSSGDFASDPGMIPVRRDDTCVKGMNCFEEGAGIDVIPNWMVNNRDLEKFLNSPEGKEAYEQVSAIDAEAGDMIQFIRPVDVTDPKKGAREAASYALKYGGNPLNYPYHVGLMNSDSTYLGDGSAERPVHEKSIYMDDDKRFDFESAGIFGDVAKFFMTDDNKKKANYYRLKDKEARQKQLDAATKAKNDGVDVYRSLYKNETPTGYVGNPYYNSMGSYPSAY